MTFIEYSRRLGPAMSLALIFLACSDPPTKVFAACAGVYVDLPPAPRPWDTSDVALVAAIASESGHAVVAFKEPASARMLETGCRAPVSAATVNAGLDTLRFRGAQIIDLYDLMGAAHVRIDASLAPTLRANRLVDYIEPRKWRHLD